MPQKGVVYFKHITDSKKLHLTIEDLKIDAQVVCHNPRYLIATDYKQLVALDTKKGTTLDIQLKDIDRSVDFFYGWIGDYGAKVTRFVNASSTTVVPHRFLFSRGITSMSLKGIGSMSIYEVQKMVEGFSDGI